MASSKYWDRLPWDGQGWGNAADSEWKMLHRASASAFRRRVPLPMRLPIMVLQHALWPAAALSVVYRFARRRGLTSDEMITLFVDCLLAGSSPLDAYVWRRVFGNRHPLAPRAAALLLSQLGDPRGHQLLADKLATVNHLAAAGIPVPAQFGIVGRHSQTVTPLPHTNLLVKPRHGAASRGVFPLLAVGNTDTWRISNGSVVSWPTVERCLVNEAGSDDLLLEEKLEPSQELIDLSADGWAPVLRLTTAREPGGASFLHSALLVIPVPGYSRRNFLRGNIYAPIDVEKGRMLPAYCLETPHSRHNNLPWNAQPLAGRNISDLSKAVQAVIAASNVIPSLALINWDLIVTDRGAVILEGNSVGNWILTELPRPDGLTACHLPTLLSRWITS